MDVAAFLIGLGVVTIFPLRGASTSFLGEHLPADYANQPLRFEANIGQADATVGFLAHGPTGHLLLTRQGAWLTRPPGDSESKSRTLRLNLCGANAHPVVEPLEKLPGRANYFGGNDPARWHTNAPTYARVKFHDVYPGVDLVYYGNQQKLEYDFIVQPGAKPDGILLEFTGAEKITLESNGDLLLQQQGDSVRQHRPVVYQEVAGVRQELAGNYVLDPGMRIGFRVANYDRTRPLIIDPVLSFATTFGGNGLNRALAVAVDSEKNVYVTGSTTAADFPAAHGFQTALLGAQDAFVVKFNTNGVIVYSTYLGGGVLNDLTTANKSSGQGIAVDTNGNVFVTGYTSSTNFPVKNAWQPTNASLVFNRCNAFVTQLNPAGNALVYSTYLGGKGIDAANGIALDTDGSAIITGYASSVNFPTVNAAQPVAGGNGDAFVARLSPDGSQLIYSTYLGGDDIENMKQFSTNPADSGGAIAVDFAGNAYVTGWTYSLNFPVLKAFQATNATSFPGTFSAAYITKLDRSGSLVYSTYLGGQLGDFGRAIGVDLNGKAYIAGNDMFGGLPTAHAFQSSSAGSGGDNIGDGFVAALDATGTNLIYSTYLGGSGDDQINGIAVRPEDGAVAVTGFTDSPDFPLRAAVQSAGNQGFFISNEAGDGWTPSNVGLNSGVLYAIQVDPSNPSNLYVLTKKGCFKSTDAGAHWVSASDGLTSFASLSASGNSGGLLAMDPLHPHTLYAATYAGVFKTTDGAAHWTSVSTGLPVNPSVQTLAINPTTPTTIYAGTSSKGVYKSADGGSTWQAMNTGLNVLNVQALLVDPNKSNTVYAGVENFGAGVALYKSLDGGGNWKVLGGGLAGGAVAAIAAGPAGSPGIYAVVANDFGFPILNLSTDGGQTWSRLLEGNGFKFTALAVGAPIPPSSAVLAFTRSGNGDALSWSAALTGYVLQSTPTLSPATWHNAASPPVVSDGKNVVTIPFSDAQAFYRLILTDNAPASSPALYLGTDQASGQGVLKSTDGGKTWNDVGLAGDTVNALAIHPANPATIYAGLAGGRDAFLATLSSDGQLFLSTYAGGSGADQANAVAVDFTTAWITGSSSSVDFPSAANPLSGRARPLSKTSQNTGHNFFKPYDKSLPCPDLFVYFGIQQGGRAGQPFLGVFTVVTSEGNPTIPSSLTIASSNLPHELSFVYEDGPAFRSYYIRGTPKSPGTYHLTVHCTKGTCPYDDDITVEISAP